MLHGYIRVLNLMINPEPIQYSKSAQMIRQLWKNGDKPTWKTHTHTFVEQTQRCVGLF